MPFLIWHDRPRLWRKATVLLFKILFPGFCKEAMNFSAGDTLRSRTIFSDSSRPNLEYTSSRSFLFSSFNIATDCSMLCVRDFFLWRLFLACSRLRSLHQYIYIFFFQKEENETKRKIHCLRPCFSHFPKTFVFFLSFNNPPQICLPRFLLAHTPYTYRRWTFCLYCPTDSTSVSSSSDDATDTQALLFLEIELVGDTGTAIGWKEEDEEDEGSAASSSFWMDKLGVGDTRATDNVSEGEGMEGASPWGGEAGTNCVVGTAAELVTTSHATAVHGASSVWRASGKISSRRLDNSRSSWSSPK